MQFEQAMQWLESLTSFERDWKFENGEGQFNLERFRGELGGFLACGGAGGCDFGDLKYVHVAGSKGKGTVCGLVAEYLSASGKSVGLFTSPHFVDVRERVRVDGAVISELDFGRIVGELAGYLDGDSGGDGDGRRMSYFEAILAVALKYFGEVGVDFVILEVGLGGRLDATNVVMPEVSVVTRIELEHADILGDTLEKIANEKLGIVKEGRPVVVGRQEGDLGEWMEKEAWKRGASDVMLVGEFDGALRENLAIVVAVLRLLLEDCDLALLGRVVESYSPVGKCDFRQIDGKDVVFDVAHTVRSFANLLDGLDKRFVGRKLVFLLSFLKDKDYGKILAMIEGLGDDRVAGVVFTQIDGARGEDPGLLMENYGGVASVIEDPAAAYSELFGQQKNDQVLVVAGSHYLVGKILSLIEREEGL
jgi:dihydrofolate synthase / folylpolyglutamate synthase